MNDKELLELAAKAAGIKVLEKRNGYWLIQSSDQSMRGWNPLTDDGDALRLLAVMPSLWTLKLMFGIPSIVMDVAWGAGKGIVVSRRSSQDEDRSEAIRRAIVMAMAEITLKREGAMP